MAAKPKFVVPRDCPIAREIRLLEGYEVSGAARDPSSPPDKPVYGLLLRKRGQQGPACRVAWLLNASGRGAGSLEVEDL